jgi:hypothetical protein
VTLGTSYLTERTLAGNITEPGQPDGARPDAAETCRACLFWSGAKRDHWGALKPAICRKARQLLPGRRLGASIAATPIAVHVQGPPAPDSSWRRSLLRRRGSIH